LQALGRGQEEKFRMPKNPPSATVRDVEAAARGMGVHVQVFNAGTSREIDAAFANLVRERSDAVFVSGDAFLTSRRVQLATPDSAPYDSIVIFTTRSYRSGRPDELRGQL
jgi:hypothetical protein